ncbi:acetylornithine transaminase [Silvimonas soli]|uniref:acetylornithine transaminase n=1 Tax=Silvimonas soli TaxID=2980100 RepID=UPI0024B32B36|nr:acetylornithine transaminase [Silvimonas soli]
MTGLTRNTTHLMPITERPPIVFTRGAGSYLYDEAGLAYLDWMQGWAVNCLGHAPDVIVAALARQASTLITSSPAFHNLPAAELASLLVQHSAMDQVFLANTGAEANEGAIKLARKWGQLHKQGAFEVITFGKAFHGRTIAMMSASGKPGWDTYFPPQVPGFPKATLNDLNSVRALIGPQTVAIMLEPIQGEGGVNPASLAFMRGLRALCDEHYLLLILDEIQTGCGRTGTLFGYQQYGIEPDIMTLGKGLGGGVPISALLAKQHCCVFEHGDQGGTFCGNPLTAAVGIAVFNALIAPGFLENIELRSQQLTDGLQQISHDLDLGEVRGAGLLLALELAAPIGPQVVDAARRNGLLLNSPRPQCLRFMPALNSTEVEIRNGLRILRQTLEHCRNAQTVAV